MGITEIITCIDCLTTPNSTSYHKVRRKDKILEHSLGQKCVLSRVLGISSVINSFVKGALDV